MTVIDLTIRAVVARAVSVPLTRPISTANSVIPVAPLVLIDVATKQGVIGRSYLFCYTPLVQKAIIDLIDNMAELIVGQAVDPVLRMRELSDRFLLLGRQGLVGIVIAGFDMAFWDALGQASAMSVARLLGGNENPVQAYISHGFIDAKRDEEIIQASLDEGFTAMKIKIGRPDPRQDEATIAAVRSMIGDNVRLMVDYNQSLSVPEAIRRIRRLEKYDLEWVEEPVAAEDHIGHARVRNSVNTPIQTGENWWYPEDAARAYAAEASDFAMLDIMKIGGVTGWNAAAGYASGARLPVSSHLFIEASAHVLAVTPSAHYLEYLDVAGEILLESPMISSGTLAPKGPGLGMIWNESAVAQYLV